MVSPNSWTARERGQLGQQEENSVAYHTGMVNRSFFPTITHWNHTFRKKQTHCTTISVTPNPHRQPRDWEYWMLPGYLVKSSNSAANVIISNLDLIPEFGKNPDNLFLWDFFSRSTNIPYIFHKKELRRLVSNIAGSRDGLFRRSIPPSLSKSVVPS